MSEQNKKFSDFMQGIGFTVTVNKRKIVSLNQISPGEIYSFKYKGKSFVIFVTRTRKTARGYYVAANTKNLLITGFKLPNDIPPDSIGEGIKLLVKNLFFRKKSAKYKGIVSKTPISTRVLNKLGNEVPGDRIAPSKTRGLISVAGKDSFRTFIFSYMKNIRKYEVKEKPIREQED